MASGRAKLVDVRPPRATNTAASGNRSGVGIAVTSGTSSRTKHSVEDLGRAGCRPLLGQRHDFAELRIDGSTGFFLKI